jgi:hypothetical protein
MAKKSKATPKHVEIRLPVPHDHPDLPKKIVVLPVHVKPEHVEPLSVPLPPVDCIVTIHDAFWTGTYLVLTAAPGSTLPELHTGQKVAVQFSPPPNKE